MNDTLLKACRGEPVPYTPVWMMRQGGRFIPRYRELVAKNGFLTVCRTPELAAEATILPLSVVDVDSVILFSDILTTAEPMGMPLRYEDATGPHFISPVRTKADVDRLVIPDPEEKLGFMMAAAKIVARELKGKVPDIGFAGAPFTMAAYMVEGGASTRFFYPRKMMFEAPEVFTALVGKVARLTTEYLRGQIKAGVDAIMFFDSLAKIIGPAEYARFALPFMKESIAALRGEGVPIIYYVNGAAPLLDLVKQTRPDVVALDYRVNLGWAAKQLGKDFAVQGNLDPYALLAPPEEMEARVKEILDEGKSAKGHVFNLGDGIQPETTIEQAKRLVDAVHRLSRR
ncbi:MAG: uroporphyrinogen decarboxylase [Dehalococcoidia bacterium]|nr:MAG: uroporphyrinogen decarboxylase [Dehalococcoidia bacterium]